jgi:hypothetical protein
LLLPDADGECAFRAEGVSLERTLLRLSSARPCVLALPGALVTDARIELSGPVTLVLGERARIERTGFVGERTDAGAPLLDIDLSEVARSAIGDGRRPFEGMLSARHTMFTSSSVRAEDAVLESVVFLHAQLDFDALDAIDATFAGAWLDLGAAVFGGCSFDRVDFRSCSSLLVAGSEIYKSVLRGCGEERVRIYNSTIGRSMLDGWFESDTNNIESMQLGLNGPTDFVQFGGVINKVAFCEHAASYRLGELANSSCTRCIVPGALEPGGACNVSEIDRVTSEECEPLVELQACEDDDVPTHRPRPPTRLP